LVNNDDVRASLRRAQYLCKPQRCLPLLEMHSGHKRRFDLRRGRVCGRLGNRPTPCSAKSGRSVPRGGGSPRNASARKLEQSVPRPLLQRFPQGPRGLGNVVKAGDSHPLNIGKSAHCGIGSCSSSPGKPAAGAAALDTRRHSICLQSSFSAAVRKFYVSHRAGCDAEE
jgi:hypothetical protein